MVTRMPVVVTAPRLGAAIADMDRWLDRFFGADGPSTSEGWAVPVAVWEVGGTTHLEAELPGVTKEDLEITVDKGTLTIAGERKHAEGERNYVHNGLRYGRMERRFRLPEWVDSESIQADLQNGVLHLTFSKLPQAQPKKIEVRVS